MTSMSAIPAVPHSTYNHLSGIQRTAETLHMRNTRRYGSGTATEGNRPVVLRTATVPGLADAERAAAVLADAGVGQVVLFGSVARGEATERSDIDLMAIYDDLDYSQRWRDGGSCRLRRQKQRDIRLMWWSRTGPEWKVRTEAVHTSLESRAARHGVVIVDGPAGDVDWDKEMAMPVNDYQEALYRLGLAANALSALHGHLQPGSVERIERQLSNEVRAFDEYLVRLRRACGHAHAVVEASVKALIHLGADPQRPAWGHDIAALCDHLVEPHRSALPPLLQPHGAAAISPWHARARYHREGRDPDATPDLVTDLAREACTVATYTAAQFHLHPTVDTVRAYVGYVEDYLDGYDIADGQRR